MAEIVRLTAMAKSKIVWRALKKTLPFARIARLLTTVFSITGFALLFLNISLIYHYDENRPKVSQPAAGRIYPLNTHGSIVYLTKNEQTTLDMTWVGFFACFGVAMCLDALSRSKMQ